MDRRKINKLNRDKRIRRDYQKLRDVKEHNVAKYTHAYICAKLGAQYFLSELTIQLIVSGTDE
jgi:hypothetical protein